MSLSSFSSILFPRGERRYYAPAATRQDQPGKAWAGSLFNVGREVETRQGRPRHGEKRTEAVRAPKFGISRPNDPAISKETMRNCAITPLFPKTIGDLRAIEFMGSNSVANRVNMAVRFSARFVSRLAPMLQKVDF